MTTCIDLRQFSSSPYRSGVQRVLVEMLRSLSKFEFDAWVLMHRGSHFGLISIDDAVNVLDACFAFDGEHREDLNNLSGFVQTQLYSADFHIVSLEQCLSIFDSWLVPEPSFQQELIESWERVEQCMPLTAIFHDALPLTRPEHYNPASSDLTSRYFRWVSQRKSVIANSHSSLQELIELAGGNRKSGWRVAHLSGDHAKRFASKDGFGKSTVPYFLCVSSVEPRKRFPLVLHAFKEFRNVYPDFELVVIGRASIHSSFEQLISDEELGQNVRWLRAARDEIVFTSLEHAAASISVGDEGFGLMPLESLSLSTRVILGGIQPAQEAIPETDLLYTVNPLDTQTLARTMAKVATDLTDPKNSSKSQHVNLPTWDSFAEIVSSTITAQEN